jgi:hypothetical protein
VFTLILIEGFHVENYFAKKSFRRIPALLVRFITLFLCKQNEIGNTPGRK